MKKLIAATLLLISTSALATFDGGTAKIEKVLVYEQGDLVLSFQKAACRTRLVATVPMVITCHFA